MTESATRSRYTGPVTIEAVTDDKPVQRSNVDNSKFEALVRASWDKRQSGHQEPATSFTVNKDASKLVDSRLRLAAKTLGLGIAVDIFPHDHPAVKHLALTEDKVRIKFEARPKSKRGRKPGSTTNGTTEAPAAPQRPAAKAAGARK